MNARIIINGTDSTDSALLEATRINYDSTRKITTANITIIGPGPGNAARYDAAYYDADVYGVDIGELYVVTILDARDNSKLFEGQIYAFNLKQTDGEFETCLYECDLNDYGSWLDRSVAWDDTFSIAMPASDQALIRALVGQFCPQISTAHVQMILPTITAFEWKAKTLRQCLDDVAGLSAGEWNINFNAELFYGTPDDAPIAPYALSTTPDFVTTFPVRVDDYKRDFTNAVNHAYIRGAYNTTTYILAQADYKDPVSIEKYGEYSYATVDEQITETLDAELQAKTMVLKYAYPVEQGSFTVWSDDLKLGMQVAIHEDTLGIDGAYIIRSLGLVWKDKHVVEYKAQFGAAQPDLETYLRLLDQRTRWKSINRATSSGPPAPGSVTDSSIAAGGLSAQSIGSVNANTILGQITSGQIGSVAAGVIVGQIASGQIGSVAAATIQGAITAGQIGSVAATTIQGVVVSSQLADGIIDTLSKYAAALAPVQVVKTGTPWPPTMPNSQYPANSYFWFEPNGRFYQVTSDGLTWTDLGADPDAIAGKMSFYTIGRLTAKNITGLIVAAQIQSITAGQITGAIQAAQIGAVNASTIQGSITASQIASVNASAIAGSITAGQIASVNSSAISGSISAAQIGSINAATITIGQVGDSQISAISGGKITAGSVTSDKLSAISIDVGGGGSKPGVINVYDGSSTNVAQIGTVSGGQYGGWFKVFGAGGTGYSSAKVYTDTSGNLFIKDADFNISGKIKTSTATFDATYSTLALNNDDGTDKASFISRGIVFYNGGSKIGSLVRGPSGNALQLECNVTGGNYVLIDGAPSGRIRSDGGFQVSSSTGQAATYTSVDGAQLVFKGGIMTSYTAANVPVVTHQLNIPIYGGSGWYECYFTNGLLSGFTQH